MQNFNYHSHTYRCVHADLDYTDEEYIQDYIKMGFKKVAITDHCPEKSEIDKRQHMRMKYSQKDEYLNSIKQLKEKYADKIEIQSGYEVEYLPGEEENIRELKEETDKLILGQHFIYDDNKQLKIFGKKEEFTEKELIRYAEYLDKAMELKIPDIIAHPDIYMLKRNEFGDIETKVAHMICKSAEKYNIPLEINLNNIFANTYYENRTLNNEQIEKLCFRTWKHSFYFSEFSFSFCLNHLSSFVSALTSTCISSAVSSSLIPLIISRWNSA